MTTAQSSRLVALQLLWHGLQAGLRPDACSHDDILQDAIDCGSKCSWFGGDSFHRQWGSTHAVCISISSKGTQYTCAPSDTISIAAVTEHILAEQLQSGGIAIQYGRLSDASRRHGKALSCMRQGWVICRAFLKAHKRISAIV